MSRRIQNPEELDYYNDFIIDPGVALEGVGEAAIGTLRAVHYGTGYANVVNPISMGETEEGHPGCLKMAVDGASSDNAQAWLKFGYQSKLKDFTRVSCTLRLGQVPTVDEVGGLTLNLGVDSVWGSINAYFYKVATYSYLFPDFHANPADQPQEWFQTSSRDAQVITYADSTVLTSSNPPYTEWHNVEVRLDYEAGSIKWYLDGQLVSEETNVPEVMWNHVAYPGVWLFDNADGDYALIDEIGWSCRKPLVQVDDPRTELAKTLRTGTTRRTNR